MKEQIEQLCREYTDLSDKEIVEIQEASKILKAMANMSDADAFLDCPIADGSGDAIVVAEAKPLTAPSSYEGTVVGMIARKEKEPAVERAFRLGVTTKYIKAVTQENANVVQSVVPIITDERVIGVYIIEERLEKLKIPQEHADAFFSDSTEQEEYVDIIRQSRDSQIRVADCIDEGLVFVNADNLVVYCNKAAEEMYKKIGFIHRITGKDYDSICLTKETEEEKVLPITVKEVKAGNYYFKIKRTTIGTDQLMFLVNIWDITQKKHQEKELILKSVAMKEMNHRVKNNLQTIVSLLRLQKNKMESEDARMILDDTINRILVIAGTHKILMMNERDVVSLGDIIADIRNNMLRSYEHEDFELDIQCYGGDFEISTEKAVSVAFVLSELIQNSVKHAFHGRKSGRITIESLQKGMEDTKIIYKDNGCGFDVEKVKESGSMGATIINLMVREKLKGHMSVRSDENGTEVKIFF